MKEKREGPVTLSNVDVSDIVDIKHVEWGRSGRYVAYEKGTDHEVGYTAYTRPGHDDYFIQITGTYIDPDWRRKKIATAFYDHMHGDYPQHFIHYGGERPEDTPTPGWIESLAQTLPDWKNTIVSEGAREEIIDKSADE